MKLTIFLGGLSGGGTERVVCNLANYLVERGHDVEILTMSDDKASYSLSSSVKRISLLKQEERKSFIHNSLLRIRRLRKHLQSSDTEKYVVMLPATIVLLLAMHKFTNAPIIVSERADPARISPKLQILLKHLAKHSSGFVFQTEDALKWYKPYIRNAKYEIIPNAINQEFIQDIPVRSCPRDEIVAVGRFTDQKNFGLLIKSFKAIHQQFPNYKLVIYGDGPKRDELEQLASKLGIGDCIDMPGYVTNISEHIVNASIFVLSSDFEGIPNSLMEAMALGLPCIATDCPVGGPRSLINNGTNGLLIRTGDKDELVASLKKLLSNKKLAETIGNNATQIVERLHPDVIYSKWEKFLIDTV